MVLCPEHPKGDQNLKFTPLSEMMSIPAPFHVGKPHPKPPPPTPRPSSLFQQIKSGHQIKVKPAGLRIFCLSENLHLTIWKSAPPPLTHHLDL